MTKRVHRPIAVVPVHVTELRRSADCWRQTKVTLTVKDYGGESQTFTVPESEYASLEAEFGHFSGDVFELVLRRRGSPERLWDWRKREDRDS